MLLPIQIQAKNEIEIPYYNPAQDVLYRPDPAIVEKLTEEYNQAQSRTKATNYASNCVYFLQNYLYGRIGLGWGPGGRYLPLTSTPEIGDVVVFTYTHVAYIKDIVNGNLVLLEANYVHGQITQNRQVAEGDATIRGYYHP